MSNRERFLVTGCAGFIGSHITRHLVEQGIETVGIDDFSTGKPGNIADIREDFTFIEGSLCDPDMAMRACSGITHILHQASIPSVPRSVSDPITSMHSSVTATVTLLKAAMDAKVKRVVQAGSSSAYGNSELLPKTEDMLPNPMSPYAAAKLAQEHYARAFSCCYGLDTVTLRYFNVFGPRQDPESDYAAVIPKFITLMLAGKQPTIHGDGLQSRDFTYVENIIHANLLAARHPEPLAGEMFNIACGDRISLLDLTGKLNRILGTDLAPIHDQARPGDVKHSQAGINKARQILGFTPRVSFEEGLEKAVEYYRQLKAGTEG